jgi:D-glycero-D-manno-heptose 1,7-bisphosphate phosphatase
MVCVIRVRAVRQLGALLAAGNATPMTQAMWRSIGSGEESVRQRNPSRAIFLDRDGTLIHNVHYCRNPEQVHLLPGVSRALGWLSRAGYRLIVITNQSGVARGYVSERELALVHARLRRDLAAEGVRLDAIYYCPHHPQGAREEYTVACLCRKPAPGLLLRAAVEQGVALACSWFVGDILADVEAGNRAGCRTVLVDLGTEPRPEAAVRTPTFVARNLPHAARLILAADGKVRRRVEPLPLAALDRPRLSQGVLRPGDPSPIPTAQWVVQAALEGAR